MKGYGLLKYMKGYEDWFTYGSGKRKSNKPRKKSARQEALKEIRKNVVFEFASESEKRDGN
jgi:hypothetical protein